MKYWRGRAVYKDELMRLTNHLNMRSYVALARAAAAKMTYKHNRRSGWTADAFYWIDWLIVRLKGYLFDCLSFDYQLVSHFDAGVQEALQEVGRVEAHQIGGFIQTSTHTAQTSHLISHWYHEYPSIPINAPQYPSIPFNTNQYPSIPIIAPQYQSIPINTHYCPQYPSIPINTNQYPSIPINTHYCPSIPINTHYCPQYPSIPINTLQYPSIMGIDGY